MTNVPMTLLEIAGAPLDPSPLQCSVLVLIDAQHMCVSATTRAALDLGYRCTVVANATATRDLPHPLERGVTRAEIVHEGTLAALADRFAVIVADAAAFVARDRSERMRGAASCG